MKKKWFIHVKIGLLEPKHVKNMKDAIWLFLHLIDDADWATGQVAWTIADAATVLGLSQPTIRKYKARLESAGYIDTSPVQHSHLESNILAWRNPRAREPEAAQQWPQNPPASVNRVSSFKPDQPDGSDEQRISLPKIPAPSSELPPGQEDFMEDKEGARTVKEEEVMGAEILQVIGKLTGRPRRKPKPDELAEIIRLQPAFSGRTAKYFLDWWQTEGPFKNKEGDYPYLTQVIEYWETATTGATRPVMFPFETQADGRLVPYIGDDLRHDLAYLAGDKEGWERIQTVIRERDTSL
jgi:hypothetical protein